MFKNKDLKSVVLALAGANGTSGNENEAALLAKSMLEEYMPAHIDTLGSVCGDTGGDGVHIMLDAHIDRIGMTVTAIDDSGFIKLIEETGAYVCADRFCFGSLPGRMEIELNDEEDALTQVCRHYVYNGHCPRMFNMEKVYGRKAYVNDIAREYNAEGIIYQQIKFCDPWAYERLLGSTMLREEYNYPVLSVDRPYNISSSVGQMRTRVQAFVESIEIKKLQGGAK